MDAAGRRQYLYHPSWRVQKDRVKFDRALRLAESLPAARRRVTMDLRSPEPTRERALATAFRMLDTGSLRVGSEQYAEANGSHGLATLLCSHATVSGEAVFLNFPAKSGQEWQSEITDADLASVIRALKRRGPNARLLAWKDGSIWHPVVAADINAYVKERTGGVHRQGLPHAARHRCSGHQLGQTRHRAAQGSARSRAGPGGCGRPHRCSATLPLSRRKATWTRGSSTAIRGKPPLTPPD